MIEHVSKSPSIVTSSSDLADDTLHGAEAIAEFLYGDREQTHIRKVYHHASAASANRLPTFRLSNMICARKSTILEWIKVQEARSTAGAAQV
jgi:hypothetical protein